MINKPELGERLKDLRIARKLTIKEVCLQIEMSQSLLSNYESGCGKTEHYKSASLENIAKLAKFYGVTLDFLAGFTGAKTPAQQNIHEQTGLSANAVEKLLEWENIKQFWEGGKTGLSPEISAINFIIEHADKGFLRALHNYLFARYFAPDGWSIENVDNSQLEWLQAKDDWHFEFRMTKGREPTLAEMEAEFGEYPQKETDKVLDHIPIIVDNGLGYRYTHHLDNVQLSEINKTLAVRAMEKLRQIAEEKIGGHNAKKD